MSGDTRQVRKFLLLPRWLPAYSINGSKLFRWLEYATIEQGLVMLTALIPEVRSTIKYPKWINLYWID
jgi:hypothetical protein